ncbi:MAG: aminotransferase class V-fold PLP-dependent enzyme [Pseudomonadota bacterium]
MNAPRQHSLDPQDWAALRAQGHAMLDDMFGYLENIRERPVWQPIPAEVRSSFRDPLPAAPTDIATAHARFMEQVLPYAVGNAHPRFMGWVHGGGTPVGMLAEMVAAGLNANLGGRDQMPLEVERQIVAWMRQLFGFPETASGLFVTGSSMANLVGLLVARTAALGAESRKTGLAASGLQLVAYTSADAHGCIAQAMAIAGLGTDALRRVPVDARRRLDVGSLARMMAADKALGRTRFFVAGTAGTVDAGAVDDLAAIAAVAREHGAWFHVDGAYGALGMLAPDVAPLLAGIGEADSIALDFHKWGQVPYDAGFILVRREADQLAAFSSPAAYLARHPRGLAASAQPWPCDLGPDLSRGFRALKTWFTLVTHGTDAMGAAISHSCRLARYLEQRVNDHPELEMLAPVELNIVCFRYCCTDPNAVNTEIVADLHESGIAVPSATTLDGRIAIRAAIVNHRTTSDDIDALLDATLACGRRRTAPPAAPLNTHTPAPTHESHHA